MFREMSLYAWVGEDELGSGEIGIKQGLVPAGFIPLVATSLEKMANLKPQMEEQAKKYGVNLVLARFDFRAVITDVTPIEVCLKR